MGRRQAFNALAGRALHAETCCLRYIRENRLYREQSANWEDFCDSHVGISRAQIDRTIQCLDEFGEPYFQLAEIVRVSPDTFRALLPHISVAGLEYKGEIIPIEFDEAPRLIAAVNALRPRKPAASRPLPLRTYAANNFINNFPNLIAQLRDCSDRFSTLPCITPRQREELADVLALFRSL